MCMSHDWWSEWPKAVRKRELTPLWEKLSLTKIWHFWSQLTTDDSSSWTTRTDHQATSLCANHWSKKEVLLPSSCTVIVLRLQSGRWVGWIIVSYPNAINILYHHSRTQTTWFIRALSRRLWNHLSSLCVPTTPIDCEPHRKTKGWATNCFSLTEILPNLLLHYL